MSEADEMFEKLGYEKNLATYINTNNKVITFDYVFEEVLFGHSIITMEELEAINEKVKELGWNE